MDDLNTRILLAGLAQLGVREIRGKRNNPKIVVWLARVIPGFRGGDETEWCSAFIMHVCEVTRADIYSSGITPNAVARSWQKVGVPVMPEDARPGDIATIDRPGGPAWQGHVGILVHMDDAWVYLLGGNQSNRVWIAAYAKERLLAIRRLSPLRMAA